MSKAHNPADFVPLFKSIGLSDAKASEAAKGPKSAASLKELIEENSSVMTGLDEKKAGLAVSLAGSLSKAGVLSAEARTYLLARIVDGSLKSVDQVTGALQDFPL